MEMAESIFSKREVYQMEDEFMTDIMEDRKIAGRLTIADWEELLRMEMELYDKLNQYQTAIDDKYGDSMILRKVKDLQQQMIDVFHFLNGLYMSTEYYKGEMNYEAD